MVGLIGVGISVPDLQAHIGKFNSTSNYCDERTYGCRGEALASIAALSLLSIDSKCGTNQSYHASFGDVEVECSDGVRNSAGTTVSAKSIFHLLSVRQKSLKPLTEMTKIKEFIRNMSMLHYDVQFTLTDTTSGSNAELIRLPSHLSVATRFCYCHSSALLSKLTVSNHLLSYYHLSNYSFFQCSFHHLYLAYQLVCFSLLWTVYSCWFNFSS